MLYRMSTPQISNKHSTFEHCAHSPKMHRSTFLHLASNHNLRDFEISPCSNNLYRCRSSRPFLKAVSFQRIFSKHQKPADPMGMNFTHLHTSSCCPYVFHHMYSVVVSKEPLISSDRLCENLLCPSHNVKKSPSSVEPSTDLPKSTWHQAWSQGRWSS